MSFGLRRSNAGIVTRRLELTELIQPEGVPPIALVLRHAGTTNAAWDSYMLKRPAPPTPALGDPEPEVTAETRLADRAKDRANTNEMLSKCCVEGWENVLEDDKTVPFSVEAARRFLDELAVEAPDTWIRIQRFVYSVGNFRGRVADKVELGKG